MPAITRVLDDISLETKRIVRDVERRRVRENAVRSLPFLKPIAQKVVEPPADFAASLLSPSALEPLRHTLDDGRPVAPPARKPEHVERVEAGGIGHSNAAQPAPASSLFGSDGAAGAATPPLGVHDGNAPAKTKADDIAQHLIDRLGIRALGRLLRLFR